MGWENLPLVGLASRGRLGVLERQEALWTSQERWCLGRSRVDRRSTARREADRQIIRYQRGTFRNHIIAASGKKKKGCQFVFLLKIDV